MIAAMSSPSLHEIPRRPEWEPDATDHLVFQWVKFDGQTQAWAARQLGISQPTVSRMVERYERWQAHARERENGRLDAAERRRAQRWLTYERNEVLLASALRIASEMEGFADVSKSVVSRPLSKPGEERQVRTETAVLDRHGIAARFLRLAFRINMEQLKLVEQEAAPLPAALTAEQMAEEERLDALVAAELAEARRRGDEEAAGGSGEADAATPLGYEYKTQPPQAHCTPLGYEYKTQPPFEPAEAFIHEVNNLNNGADEETDVKHELPCTCAADEVEEKKSRAVFRTDQRHRRPPLGYEYKTQAPDETGVVAAVHAVGF